MSNPLALFRRYQKTMLAVAAVGAMLAFGILPVMQNWLGAPSGGGKPDNPVVASWTGESMRLSDLQNRVFRRQALVNFQYAVQAQANQRGVQYTPGIVPPTISEQSIIETALLASQAEKYGVVVSDQAVVDHLEQGLAGGVVNRNEMAAILKQVTQNRLTQTQLIEAYKTELAAHRMRVLAAGGSFSGSILDNVSTPAQTLDYYKRLSRRMEAEVLEFPADDYMAEVKQQMPSDEEIKTLYEEYKEQVDNPSLPEPGFREPYRVTVDWLKADYAEILESQKAKLTEEQLRADYERNKEAYRKASLATDDEIDNAAGDDSDTETVEYQAFEDVRDDIALTLARPLAADVVRDAITQASDEMDKFYRDYTFWESTSDEGASPPSAPSLSDMADRLGLKSGTLPLISYVEAADFEIGEAFDLAGEPPRKVMFADKVFQPNLPKYKPSTILAPNDDSRYAFWKTEVQEDYVPTLEQAKPAIVKYWQRQKALEVAKQKAEEVAAKLRASNQSLQTMFAGDESKEITETGEITWMTYGGILSGTGEPRISSVPGVEYAGEQFMKDISSLESGGTVVTTNNPETKAYVVYVNAVTSSEDDLRQLFLSESNNFGVRSIASIQDRTARRDWYLGLREKLNYEYNDEATN